MNGLALVDAHAGFGSVEVVHGTTILAPNGVVTALVGRNGAGKSSVVRCFAGLLALRAGALRWDGRDVTSLSPSERARAGMTVVPDERGVFPGMTVEENLRLFAGGGPLDAAGVDRALDVFPELGRHLDQPAGTMSGGERQMLALSRVFIRPGRAVLVDELSRGLSRDATARCYSALADLAGPDRALVVVEQYVDDVLRIAGLVYVLTRGVVTFAGEPGELSAGASGSEEWRGQGL